MGKSQDRNDPFPIGRDKIGDLEPQVRLNIKEIRRRAELLRSLPNGSELPDWTDLSYSDRIAIIMRLLPPDQREVLLGRSQKQLDRYAAGGGMPFSVAAALAIETEIPLDWIATGRPQGGLPAQGEEGFSLVPRYEVRAGAGGGVAQVEMPPNLSGFIAFRTEWLRRLGVNPATAETLFATGDSMEPTIRDGDLLLLDRAVDRVVDNGIYVLVVGGLILLKRIQSRRDGSLVLKSDNQHYDDEVVPVDEVHDLKIEGRIRWIARTI